MKKIKNYIKSKTKIFSLEYGVGEIIGILKLYDGIQDYIEVKFLNDVDEVVLYPINFKNDLRIISNPIELTSVLKNLSSQILNFDTSLGDRSSQRIGVDVDLDYLTNTIASLVGNVTQKLKDRELLLNCIESLILEVSHVYKINETSAKGVVSDYMRAA